VNDSVTDVSLTAATDKSVTVAGFVMTVAVTVIAADPLLPSLVAVIVAEPATIAVTSPLLLTVAIAGALLAHVIVRPVRITPAASFVVAVNCRVAPGARLAVAGLSVTDATAATPFATVVPDAWFDSAPNTAFTFRVPRYETSWN